MFKYVGAFVLVVSMLSLQGCGAALLVGAIAYADKENKEAKKDFELINIERETAGLEPLNWEEYKHGREAKTEKETKSQVESAADDKQ